MFRPKTRISPTVVTWGIRSLIRLNALRSVVFPHPLGPMLAVRLMERLEPLAPGIALSFSTRSRPIDMERALREGRIDLAVDWLPAGQGLAEESLFEDEVVAVARRGHPAIKEARLPALTKPMSPPVSEMSP